MATLYRNFLAGTITDNPLLIGATTVNSANFASLPVVAAPDIMWLTLDPDASAGAPEIVKVTAHTASATSVTVVRAQQGTAARQHALNTVWRIPWTQTDAEDVSKVESATYTPALSNMAIGTGGGATNTATYIYVGSPVVGGKGLIVITGHILFGTSGATLPAGAQERIALPSGFNFTPLLSGAPLGQIIMDDVSDGTQPYNGKLVLIDTTNVQLYADELGVAGSGIVRSDLTATVPFTWAAGDFIMWGLSASVVRV